MKILKFAAALAAGLAAVSAGIIFSGCPAIDKNPVYESRRVLDENIASQVVACLNAGDRDAFEKMFSYYGKTFQPDFNNYAEEVFEIMGNNIAISAYDSGGDRREMDGDKNSRMLDFTIELNSDSGTFYMRIEYYAVNDFDEKYEGICFMYAGTRPPQNVLPADIITPNGTQVSLYKFVQFGLYPESIADLSYTEKSADELPDLLPDLANCTIDMP